MNIKETIGETISTGVIVALVVGILMGIFQKSCGDGMVTSVLTGILTFGGAVLPSAVLVSAIKTIANIVLLAYETIVEKKTSPAGFRNGKTYTSESKSENGGISIKDTLDL